ncbi:MAG: hypothetical protein EBU90_12205 [Proteobacteria bacterium]|jgi:hypothetical protein|nr:hypothetical protein [Pseudomonadota bacterium]
MKKFFFFAAMLMGLASCTVEPQDRGLYPAVVNIVGTPIVKTQLVDTNLVVGDTIEIRYMDTLTLARIVR